jgi:hypothetical protein
MVRELTKKQQKKVDEMLGSKGAKYIHLPEDPAQPVVVTSFEALLGTITLREAFQL